MEEMNIVQVLDMLDVQIKLNTLNKETLQIVKLKLQNSLAIVDHRLYRLYVREEYGK